MRDERNQIQREERHIRLGYSVCKLFQETVLDIEYVERQAAPRPEQSLEHDDWVSAVQGAGQ